MKTAHFGIRHKNDDEITTTTEGQLNIFKTREAAQQCIDGPIASTIDEDEDSIDNYYIDDQIYLD